MKQPDEQNMLLLMVDDDEEDIYLTERAFCNLKKNLIFRSVQNNDDLFDYLYVRGKYSDNGLVKVPDVILLDINIPKTDGYGILRNIRNDAKFNYLPVVMFTTSAANSDIRKAYKLGANSFLTKSVSVGGMNEIAELFWRYWFSFNELPIVD